jgi:putative FmdB family regulatory protein
VIFVKGNCLQTDIRVDFYKTNGNLYIADRPISLYNINQVLRKELHHMPFYDLRCTACGEEFNIRASVAEREQQKIACPACGLYDLRPVFKAAHFSVKTEEAPACPNSQICGARCNPVH